MMAQLYAHDSLPWDEMAARKALVSLLEALRLEADVHNARALELYGRRGFHVHDLYPMTKWIARSC